MPLKGVWQLVAITVHCSLLPRHGMDLRWSTIVWIWRDPLSLGRRQDSFTPSVGAVNDLHFDLLSFLTLADSPPMY